MSNRREEPRSDRGRVTGGRSVPLAPAGPGERTGGGPAGRSRPVCDGETLRFMAPAATPAVATTAIEDRKNRTTVRNRRGEPLAWRLVRISRPLPAILRVSFAF